MRKVTDDELRRLWRRRAHGATDPSACLGEGDWARLLSAEADAEERSRAAAHIATCATCAERYQILHPLRSWSQDAERVLLPKRALHSRLASWAGSWWSPLPALAVAAAAAIVIANVAIVLQFRDSRRANVQLTTQLARNTERLSDAEGTIAALQERLRREAAANAPRNGTQPPDQAPVSVPELDVAVVDLEPRDPGVVRGAVERQVITVAPSATRVALILNFQPLVSPSTLEVQVLDGSRQVRWTGRARRPRESTSLSLTLPREGYPAGAYLVRLFDVTNGRAPLADYPIAIREERQAR